MVVAKGPHIVRRRGVGVVVGLRVQDPDAGEAAGVDPVVKVVSGQVGDVVDGAEAVAALVGVVEAVGHLVHGRGTAVLGQPGGVAGPVQQLPRLQGRGGCQGQDQRGGYSVHPVVVCVSV